MFKAIIFSAAAVFLISSTDVFAVDFGRERFPLGQGSPFGRTVLPEPDLRLKGTTVHKKSFKTFHEKRKGELEESYRHNQRILERDLNSKDESARQMVTK
ncbi:MAG: hypothetical protein ACPGXY_01360 [Alphaproteobacteria bacterium]